MTVQLEGSFVMADKPDERDETALIIGRKRGERSSSCSSPDIPPTKSAKTTEVTMAEHANLPSIWMMLNKIQRNTDKLLYYSGYL